MSRTVSKMILRNPEPEYELDIGGNFSFTPGGPMALVDGDPIAYAAAAMCDTATYKLTLNGFWLAEIEGGITDVYKKFGIKDYREWDALLLANPTLGIEKIVTSDESDVSMYHTLKAQIKRIIKTTGAGSLRIYLTEGAVNFRVTEGIATIKKYKGNRSPNDKPQRLSEAREYMIKEFGAIMAVDMEADDALSIDHHESWEWAMNNASELQGEGDFTQEEIAMSLVNTVLVTIDKDIKMRPGKFLNPDQDFGVEEIYPIGELVLKQKSNSKELKFKGLRGFYAQLLLGDTTDNIPGVYFCGDTRVYNVLKDCNTEEELFKAVLRETYEGFLREHVKHLSLEIEERINISVKNGASDSASNITKLRAKHKKFLLSNIAYGRKYFYHWSNYGLKEDGTVNTNDLLPDSNVCNITAIEYMTEVARLAYMITTPPNKNGDHLWQPNMVWAKEVEAEIEEMNQTRISHSWGLVNT